MRCSMCGGGELVHDIRDIPFTYNGETTIIPQISGDYCPACGEAVLDLEDGDRYSDTVEQFYHAVRARLGLSGQPDRTCPMCGGGELVHDTRDVPYTYKGHTTTIPAIEADYCDACGDSIPTREAGARFSRLLGEFAQQVDAGLAKEP
jgi:YgiT-type zinc finger domain-containing protein